MITALAFVVTAAVAGYIGFKAGVITAANLVIEVLEEMEDEDFE